MKNVETGTLKRLCNELRIPYIELESKGIIAKPCYPLDLNNAAFFRVATHILNEGP